MVRSAGFGIPVSDRMRALPYAHAPLSVAAVDAITLKREGHDGLFRFLSGPYRYRSLNISVFR